MLKTAWKHTAVNFLAFRDFANLGDGANDLEKFRRKHPGFAPFVLLEGERPVSPLDPRFLPAVLAWRDLVRKVWRGKADTWDLETLLGLNRDAFCRPWGGTAPWTELWNRGLAAIEAAGLQIPVQLPRIHARWEADGFDYQGSAFENAVFALWQSRWRARVCPMCDSYFVAKQKAQKFCSPFCSQQGKNAANRRWWEESGRDWRKRYWAEKAKQEKRERKARVKR